MLINHSVSPPNPWRLWELGTIREVPNGVGADGVGVKFPIFPVNCSRLPSFQENRQKTEKSEEKRKKAKKNEEKRKKAKKNEKKRKKWENSSDPIYTNSIKNLPNNGKQGQNAQKTSNINSVQTGWSVKGQAHKSPFLGEFLDFLRPAVCFPGIPVQDSFYVVKSLLVSLLVLSMPLPGRLIFVHLRCFARCCSFCSKIQGP